jgi:hypothetical protein
MRSEGDTGNAMTLHPPLVRDEVGCYQDGEEWRKNQEENTTPVFVPIVPKYDEGHQSVKAEIDVCEVKARFTVLGHIIIKLK